MSSACRTKTCCEEKLPGEIQQIQGQTQQLKEEIRALEKKH
jgi:hypothetical protein